MGKVTSKLQVTVPKAIADEYGIRPGDEVDWTPAGDGIRVTPRRRGTLAARADIESQRAQRLRLFDRATARQRERESAGPSWPPTTKRGWRREDLYERGRPR